MKATLLPRLSSAASTLMPVICEVLGFDAALAPATLTVSVEDGPAASMRPVLPVAAGSATS